MADSLLNINIGFVIWASLVFALLFFLLSKFAWKPILGAIKAREQFIEDALKTAEDARLQLSNLKAENEKLLDETRKERERILKEAQVVANNVINEAREKANAEAQNIVEAAKATINSEKQAAIVQIKNTIGTLSVEIAESIVRKNLNADEAQQNLVKEYLKDVKLN